MPKLSPKLVAKKIEKILAEYEAKVNRELAKVDAEAGITDGKPQQMFRDVRITAEKNKVLVTYDGAGYDYLSLNADYPSVVENGPRKTINEYLAPHRLHIEDENTWSFSIHFG